MASKLRRTPLFGYDGNLGIPIINGGGGGGGGGGGPPPNAPPSSAPQAKANGSYKVRYGFSELY